LFSVSDTSLVGARSPVCSSSNLCDKELRKILSCDELEFHFDDIYEDEKDSLRFGLGGGDAFKSDGTGEGVLLRERRGKGKSWVSSSSSMGEERSRLRESRISGPGNNSSVVDIDDTVEFEDTSRSRGFTRGYSEFPEEEAKGDAEEWDCCEDGDRERIKSVSSML
jgi:hypothetical protein